MKTLVVSDLHGRKEACANAIDKFLLNQVDKIIFLGDYTDSWDRSNEDILDVIQQVIEVKEDHPDNVELLIGNHDKSYFLGVATCSGFRPTLNVILHPLLREKKDLFKIVHKEGKYIFSHAGIQRKWFIKHLDALNLSCSKYKLPVITRDNLESLNSLIWTNDEWRIAEVGIKRGGMRGDYGGPLWCDREEMESYGPIHGFHQVVGHTPVEFIERVEKFEGGKRYNNTSVTFTDVLGKQEKFLELDI